MKYPILFLLALTILSCSKDDKTEDMLPGEVNIQELRTGQVSEFVLFTGNCGFVEGTEYTGDTLMLEVIEIEGQMHFQESFTPTSPLYEVSPDPVAYPVEVADDYILIRERLESTLFFFYGNDTVFTKPIPTAELVQDGCLPLLDNQMFAGEQITRIPEFAIHDFTLDEQFVVSCVPVFIELEAYLFYNGGDLNMSYTLDSGFPGFTMRGWRKL